MPRRRRLPKVKAGLKVILLGDHGVGKTSIQRRLITGEFHDSYAAFTITRTFQTKAISFLHTIDNETKLYKQIKLNIWDPNKQYHKLNSYSLSRLYYRRCDAAIVVYDITNRKSFQNVRKWIDELLQYIHESKASNVRVPIVIVGNKTDQNQRRQVSYQELQESCNEYKGIDENFKINNIMSKADANKLCNGFIKQSQQMVIPMDINNLCFAFYHIHGQFDSIINGFEVSAQDGTGIDQLFEDLGKIYKTMQYYDQEKQVDVVFKDCKVESSATWYPKTRHIIVIISMMVIAVCYQCLQ